MGKSMFKGVVPYKDLFEQKGLISLKNLIGIAMALGYTSEVRNLFAQQKYSTMEELTQIRKNQNKKKAHRL